MPLRIGIFLVAFERIESREISKRNHQVKSPETLYVTTIKGMAKERRQVRTVSLVGGLMIKECTIENTA